MVCYVTIVNKPTLRDLVDERSLRIFVSYSNKRHTRDGERYPAFRLEEFVLLANANYNLIKVVACVVRLKRCHFEHPATILKE